MTDNEPMNLPSEHVMCRDCHIISAHPIRIIIVQAQNVFHKYDTYLCHQCFEKTKYSPDPSERVRY